MPDLVEAPTKETINPSLAALFDVKVAEETPPAETDAVEELATEVATPTVKPPDKPEAPVAALAADKKKTDITLRLAPDFAAAETKPAAAPESELDTKELDEAIEKATTPKAKANLGKFRDQLKNSHREIETLRARPAAVPAEDTTELKTRLTQLEQENQQYLERIEKTNLWESPKFQQQYVQPRDQKFQDASAVLKESGADPSVLGRALALTGKARIDTLDEIREQIPSEMMKGRFDRLIEGIDNATRTINEKLRNSKQSAEEQQREETIRKHENSVKIEGQMKSLLGAARRDLAENAQLEVLQKVGKPEFEWWDKQVDEIDSVAEEVLLKSSPEKAAVAAVLAASAGPYRSMWQAERQARLALEEELADYKGAEPTLGKERKAPKDAAEGVEPSDIMARLQSGFYRK